MASSDIKCLDIIFDVIQIRCIYCINSMMCIKLIKISFLQKLSCFDDNRISVRNHKAPKSVSLLLKCCYNILEN